MHSGVSVPRKIAPEARSRVCTAGSQCPGRSLRRPRVVCARWGLSAQEDRSGGQESCVHGGVSVPRKIAPEARSHVCTAGSQFPGQNLLTDTHRPKLTSNATVSGLQGPSSLLTRALSRSRSTAGPGAGATPTLWITTASGSVLTPPLKAGSLARQLPGLRLTSEDCELAWICKEKRTGKTATKPL